MTRSCHDMIRFTSVNEVLGKSTGMKSKLPSFSVGMNSLPIPFVTRASVVQLRSSNSRTTGRGKPKASTSETARSNGRKTQNGFAMNERPIENGIVNSQRAVSSPSFCPRDETGRAPAMCKAPAQT